MTQFLLLEVDVKINSKPNNYDKKFRKNQERPQQLRHH